MALTVIDPRGLDQTGNYTVNNLTATGVTTLSSPANLNIGGGTTDQVLSTDGSGVLSWVTPSVNLSASSIDALSDVTITSAASGQTLSWNGTQWINAATSLPASSTISSVTLNSGYTEQVFAVTGITPALAVSNGSIQTWTLSASSTPTSSLTTGQAITLMITAGAFTITWPSVTWKTGSGTAPTLNTSGVTAVQLWNVGGVLYGARVGNN